MCWVRWSPIAPGSTTFTSAIGEAPWRGWHGTGDACYVTPKNTWACPDAEGTCARALIAYKIAAHAADLARHARAPPRPPTTNFSRARLTLFDWNKQFDLSPRCPERAPANTTTKPCRRHLQRSEILLNVRPQATGPIRPKINR